MDPTVTERILAKAKRVELIIFDVDGVLTNGALILGDHGNEYKMFHVRDGFGLVMLRNSGCHIAAISGRSLAVASQYLTELGIEYIYQNQTDKNQAFEDLLSKLKLEAQAAAYVGDDFIDLPVMDNAGFAIAVADAHPQVIKAADWTTKAKGGHGAAREVCELIMQARGTLADQVQRFLQ